MLSTLYSKMGIFERSNKSNNKKTKEKMSTAGGTGTYLVSKGDENFQKAVTLVAPLLLYRKFFATPVQRIKSSKERKLW